VASCKISIISEIKFISLAAFGITFTIVGGGTIAPSLDNILSDDIPPNAFAVLCLSLTTALHCFQLAALIS